MPRPARRAIRSPAAWRALLSPVRTEIAETLRWRGPLAVAELAALLARRPDALYRHIDVLRRAGFVVPAGYRRRGRHTEQLVDAAADDFVLRLADPRGDQENRAVVDTVRSFARATERAVRMSARARALRFAGPARNITIQFEMGRLTPARFRELRAHVLAIKDIMDAGKKARAGNLYAAFLVATPVARASGRPSPSPARTRTPARER